MSERSDGILWRIACLHPGWMTLPVACVIGLLVAPVFLAAHGPEAALATGVAAWALSVAVVIGHVLLVIAQTSGRFLSRRPRRLIGPNLAVLAMIAALIAGLALSDVNADRDTVMDGALVLFVLAAIYLQIRASVNLVEAERGFGGGTGQKIGTYLLFTFWIVGVFFIQARIRKLAIAFAEGRLADLPREKLELVEAKPGTLALVLTERVDAAGFEAYGTELIRRLDGHVRDKASPPAGVRWDVEIGGSDFWLLFDGAQGRIVLEARGDADLLMPRLKKWLAAPKTS